MSFKKNFSWLVIIMLSFPFSVLTSCKQSDSKIKTAVDKEITSNPALTGLTASVQEGVVTLTGECKDEASKSVAETSIGKIKGVKQVINNCTLPVPVSTAPVVIAEDDALTKAVADATKDHPTVKATVNDGVVTLTGEIKRPQLQQLMMTLQGLKPKKIDNQLVIK